MTDPYAKHAEEANAEVHHEESDVNVRALLWFVVAFIVAMALVFGASKIAFEVFKKMEVRKDLPPVTRVAATGKLTPPEPRLQDSPARDMTVFVKAEKDLLASTAVIDPTNGTVRIPIDRAIVLTAQRQALQAAGAQVTVPADRESGMPASPSQTPGSRESDSGPASGREIPQTRVPATQSAPQASPQR